MLTPSGSEHSKDFSDFMELRFALSAVRYLNLRKHLAKTRSMQQMLFQYGPSDFKQVVRMDVRSFERLLTLISDDPVFRSNNRNQQAPVWIQLMVVLARLGCYGNGASVGKVGINSGFSDGSICHCHCTRRVFTAILKLRNQNIKWLVVYIFDLRASVQIHVLQKCLGLL